MPNITTITNAAIDQPTRDALAKGFGEAIRLLGKSEQWLMLSFTDNTPMYFAGKDDPCAYLEVALLGSASKKSYNDMTAKLTELITSNLPIPADRVYIKYSETSSWGWNGSNF